MNLSALKEINQNQPEILNESARNNKADEEKIAGIARDAAENGYQALSDKQKYHFDNCIRPLIEDVQCSGYTHEFDDVKSECNNYLDDEVLVEYYQLQGKYCESCEAQESADAHTKESFMYD